MATKKTEVKTRGAFWLDPSGDAFSRTDAMCMQIKTIVDAHHAPRGEAWTLPARVAWVAASEAGRRRVEQEVLREEQRRLEERQRS